MQEDFPIISPPFATVIRRGVTVLLIMCTRARVFWDTPRPGTRYSTVPEVDVEWGKGSSFLVRMYLSVLIYGWRMEGLLLLGPNSTSTVLPIFSSNDSFHLHFFGSLESRNTLVSPSTIQQHLSDHASKGMVIQFSDFKLFFK